MRAYSLTHLSDAALEQRLDGLIARDRGTTAEIVAHIAEMDRRASYAPAYASMHAYCLGRLHLSEDAAYKRIQAARAAREFPILFETLADGRLHLSSVCLIAPHLSPANVGELVAMATRKSNAEIRQWLGERQVGSGPPVTTVAARQLQVRLPQAQRLAARQVEPSVAPVVETRVLEPANVPATYDMRFTMTAEDHARFRYAQALLSHAIPSGDPSEIYRRAIELLIRDGEKRKFASTPRPRAKRSPVGRRHVPAAVRRVVWTRDGGRCTFVARSGHRCGARALLEFDHVVHVARGGLATEENLRLRCRPHNQEAAKSVLGSKLMARKRREAHVRSRTVTSDGGPLIRSRAVHRQL